MGELWTTAPSLSPLAVVVLIAGTILLTIGFLIWLALTPDEPADTTREARRRLSERSRAEAARNRRRLDADAGRADHVAGDLS
ncbi:hypothetical protein [Brachybacterium hainanense]|uniref:Uncharacterized protein n=1 Tax=Brachybacterium hainanense TaxID=1541174 RepID=A0ABV6R917_9MICO